MKSLCLTLLLLISISLSGQEESSSSNNWVLGGSFSINYTGSGADDISSNNSNTYIFSPYVGKQLHPNWLLGSRINLSFSDFSFEQETGGSLEDLGTDFRNLSLEFFSRYAFAPEKKLSFYLEPNVRYGYSKLTSISLNASGGLQNITDSANFFSIGIGAGFMYDINDKIRILARIGDASFIGGRTDSFNLGLDLSRISFGVEFKF